MENWGLIAYREYALLYEEGKSPHMAFKTLRCNVGC